jgi:hypothetical protein
VACTSCIIRLICQLPAALCCWLVNCLLVDYLRLSLLVGLQAAGQNRDRHMHVCEQHGNNVYVAMLSYALL